VPKILVNPWDEGGDVQIVYPEFLDIGQGGEVAQGIPAKSFPRKYTGSGDVCSGDMDLFD